jgi:hypothetical protein
VLAVLGLAGFLAAAALGKAASPLDITTTAATATSPPPPTSTTIPNPDPPPVVKPKPVTQPKRTVAPPTRPRTVTHAAPPAPPPPPRAPAVRQQPRVAATARKAPVAKRRAAVAVHPAVVHNPRAHVARRPRVTRRVSHTRPHVSPARSQAPIRYARSNPALARARTLGTATPAVAGVRRLAAGAMPAVRADRAMSPVARWLALLVVCAAMLLSLAALAPADVLPARLAPQIAHRRLGLALLGLEVSIACGFALLLVGHH